MAVPKRDNVNVIAVITLASTVSRRYSINNSRGLPGLKFGHILSFASGTALKNLSYIQSGEISEIFFDV